MKKTIFLLFLGLVAGFAAYAVYDKYLGPQPMCGTRYIQVESQKATN